MWRLKTVAGALLAILPGLLIVHPVMGAPVAKPLPLAGRVFQKGEFPGFAANERAVAEVDVGAWAKIAPSGGVDVESRLHDAGFVAGVREELVWTDGTDRGALSVAVRLGSARAARAEIEQQVRDFAGEPKRGRAKSYATFPVPGIPGAHGFTLTSADGSGAGHNIIYSDGPFIYHLGVGWGAQASHPPTRAQLISAVRALYARVHPRPAP